MLFDIIIEFLFEILAEGFVALCDSFIPERLRSRKVRSFLSIFFFILSLALFVALIIGVVTLLETGGKSLFGWIGVGLSVAYLIAGVMIALLRKDPEDTFSDIP